MTINLSRALRVNRDARIAFVGAGGKTTAINLLAAELDTPVIVTTSTHIGRSQLKIKHRHIEVKHLSQVTNLKPTNEEILYITGRALDGERMSGLDEASMIELIQIAASFNIPVLIEADGSRGLPLKAPADHEPNIPRFVNQVVVMVGLSCLGKPFNVNIVHRFDEAMKLSGLEEGQVITTDIIKMIMRHPNGGMKNIPNGARKIAIMNQVDTLDSRHQGESLATALMGCYDSIILASLAPMGKSAALDMENFENIYKVCEPTAGVVLAAGESIRFGSPKLLKDWKGEPMIRHVVLQAMQSGLSPIIVVLGAFQEQIIDVIKDLPVTYVINNNWKEGQSSSLRCGINALPIEIGSAVFLLADQPQIQSDLINALKQQHEETLATLIVPRVRGKRANPVLFDRDVFEELKDVTGDQGGRAIFNKYPINWLDWQDEKILMDIDTPEDYNNLLNII